MTFPLYTFFYSVAAAGAAPYYLVRGVRSGKYLWSLKDRLGLNPPPPIAGRGRRLVWVHALSLGETTAAKPLVNRLLESGYGVCFSTTTRSGFEAAGSSLPSDVAQVPFPLDLPPAIRRVQQAVAPDLFVLVETDIWPNFLDGLDGRGVPAVLVGARVSPRSLAGYKKIRGFWSKVLDRFAWIGCQTEGDMNRMNALGARPEKLTVTGSLKFDRPAPESGPDVRAALLAEAGLSDRTWIVAGSTHTGEEEILLDVFVRLRKQRPGLGLLIAPRDASRFTAVGRMVERYGIVSACRSAGRAGAGTEIFLLDTLGELERFYELADVVFVGKSLAVGGEGGGQNLLEPAARAKPVLFGPRMHNFPAVARAMLEAGGGRRVEDAEELEEALALLLDDPEARSRMGKRARSVLDLHRGAVDRTMELIQKALGL